MTSDWKEFSLGDVATIVSGMVDPKAAENKDRLYVGPHNITPITGKLIDVVSAAEAGRKSNMYEFTRKHVLYSKIGPLLNKVATPDFDGICGSEVYPLLPNEEIISKEFLAYSLRTERFLKYVKKHSKRSIIAKMNRKAVLSYTLKIPTLEEQSRILKILDSALDHISKNTITTHGTINICNEIFVSKLHELFTKQGPGWFEATLEEISLDFGRGKSRHRPRNYEPLYGGKYPFVQTGDIRSSNHFITEYKQTYSELGLQQSKLWPKGTVCITIAANIAETGILDFEACFPDSVIGVVVNPKFAISEFVEYALQFFKNKLQNEGKGTAQDNINMGTFKNLKFPFAPLDEQKRIVDLLNLINQETSGLLINRQNKLSLLSELRQSILREAFDGKLSGGTPA